MDVSWKTGTGPNKAFSEAWAAIISERIPRDFIILPPQRYLWVNNAEGLSYQIELYK